MLLWAGLTTVIVRRSWQAGEIIGCGDTPQELQIAEVWKYQQHQLKRTSSETSDGVPRHWDGRPKPLIVPARHAICLQPPC